MSARLVLVVRLFIHPGREAEFRRFETEAARIMARHGGRIERAIRPTGPPDQQPLPHEIHVLSFPDATRLDAYRTDPELAALAELRQAAIARTEVIVGVDAEPYR